MKTSQEGINLIKSFESCRLEAYLDSVNVATIGWGSTRYADGTKVKIGDVISQKGADDLFLLTLPKFETSVTSLVKSQINQHQFDALVSFTYNLGALALSGSTLLKKVNINPNDPSILQEFQKWIYAGSKQLPGLVRRRQAEANLYFTK